MKYASPPCPVGELEATYPPSPRHFCIRHLTVHQILNLSNRRQSPILSDEGHYSLWRNRRTGRGDWTPSC
jgi:hypothetical protein